MLFMTLKLSEETCSSGRMIYNSSSLPSFIHSPKRVLFWFCAISISSCKAL